MIQYYFRFYIACGVFILTSIWILELGELFPYTGFKAIIVIPLIFLYVILVLLIAYKITKEKAKKTTLMFFGIVLVTLITTTTYFYPQDSDPNPIKQISNSFKAILEYEKITKDDLNPTNSINDNSYLSETMKAKDEKYIVALYKFQKKILKDTISTEGKENRINLCILNGKNPHSEYSNNYSSIPTGKNLIIWKILNLFKTPLE
jgi:hypothetical protein